MSVNVIYKSLPAFALRGMVLFPGTGFYLDVGRKKSVLAVNEAMNKDQRVFLITQKDITVEDPGVDDLYTVGVVANITEVIKSNDSQLLRVYVEGISRASVYEVLQTEPYMVCDVKELEETSREDNRLSKIAAVRTIKEAYDSYYMFNRRSEIKRSVIEAFFSENPSLIADSVVGDIVKDYKRKQSILEELDVDIRLKKSISLLREELNILKLETSINNEVDKDMEENQREYYLREKLKVIYKELGEDEDANSEIDRYRSKIKALNCSDEIREKLNYECTKLSRMQGGNIDASIIRSYLDAALAMPFGVYTKDCFDLAKARKILDRDHYGLKKIKDRFIEMLAVRARTDNNKGSIICLAGPPGVGKTSIVRSVASAMNRKYVRLSLGGVSDEAEIRGHRKTYVGAMPGRIVNALTQAKSANPIILLDEIDKLGKNFKGDPASAMLEVLDPEQNFGFRDNFMEFPIDLSSVLFITTANDVSAIPKPLYDRMEVIELSSYSPEEKFMIAKNHLVKKQAALHGLSGNEIRITDDALHYIIDGYTREAGVRRLEQVIGKICRKSVVRLNETSSKRVTVDRKLVEEMLGPVKFKKENATNADSVGVVNGLAWTGVGGELLQVECIIMDGEGKLELTGSLGDVMKESAMAAFSFIKSLADKYGIDKEMFTKKNIHIHVPQGAVPKDGPSAGVTISTALLSALTGKKVKGSIAMTGEITLTGRVLEIGGLKEKSMAAYKAGIKSIIVPEDNLSDLWDIDEIVKNNVKFIGVKRLEEVFALSLCEAESDVKFEADEVIINKRRRADEI